MTKTKQCLVCGKLRTDADYDYYLMTELFDTYKVCDISTICFDCESVASKFIEYYGVKKEEDKLKLKNFLLSGVLPKRQFQMQMNGGYCD